MINSGESFSGAVMMEEDEEEGEEGILPEGSGEDDPVDPELDEM